LFFRVTFAVHVVLLGFSAIIGLSLLLVQVLGERSKALRPPSSLNLNLAFYSALSAREWALGVGGGKCE